MTNLSTLIERVEAVGGPDRTLECEIYCTLEGLPFKLAKSVVDNCSDWVAPAYTASLDAAWELASYPPLERFGGAIGLLREAIDRLRQTGEPDDLPRYLTAAALRARMEIDHAK